MFNWWPCIRECRPIRLGQCWAWVGTWGRAPWSPPPLPPPWPGWWRASCGRGAGRGRAGQRPALTWPRALPSTCRSWTGGCSGSPPAQGYSGNQAALRNLNSEQSYFFFVQTQSFLSRQHIYIRNNDTFIFFSRLLMKWIKRYLLGPCRQNTVKTRRK